jgi:5-formyltetrahydrofolate cyclo-ligase
MQSRLRRRSADARRQESEEVRAWLRPRVAEGGVAAFFPLATEVDLVPLLEELAREGRLALPRVEASGLSLRRVGDLGELVAGPLGLREPPASAPPVALSGLAVVLVPGLAFTAAGARLGRGGGYYDRMLAGLPGNVRTIGVGFADQLVDELPMERHDVWLAEVVPAGARGPC